MKSAVSFGGWFGVIAIILAYALLSFGVIDYHAVVYQLLNLTGATAIILEAYSKKDYQPVVLNIVWLLIALIGLVQILRQ